MTATKNTTSAHPTLTREEFTAARKASEAAAARKSQQENVDIAQKSVDKYTKQIDDGRTLAAVLRAVITNFEGNHHLAYVTSALNSVVSRTTDAKDYYLKEANIQLKQAQAELKGEATDNDEI